MKRKPGQVEAGELLRAFLGWVDDRAEAGMEISQRHDYRSLVADFLASDDCPTEET